jgi:hypothetical protein
MKKADKPQWCFDSLLPLVLNTPVILRGKNVAGKIRTKNQE